VTPVFWSKLDPVQNQQVHRAAFELLSYSLPPPQSLEQLTVLRGCEFWHDSLHVSRAGAR
jgi:hypothetical protein